MTVSTLDNFWKVQFCRSVFSIGHVDWWRFVECHCDMNEWILIFLEGRKFLDCSLPITWCWVTNYLKLLQVWMRSGYNLLYLTNNERGTQLCLLHGRLHMTRPDEWENQFMWVKESSDGSREAYCTVCHCNLAPRLSSLQNHEKLGEHQKKQSAVSPVDRSWQKPYQRSYRRLFSDRFLRNFLLKTLDKQKIKSIGRYFDGLEGLRLILWFRLLYYMLHF